MECHTLKHLNPRLITHFHGTRYERTCLSKGRFTHSMLWQYHANAVPLPCRAANGTESHLIYTVRTFLIHTYHPAPMKCCAVALRRTEFVRTWHGRGMASVNQTRPQCINQMGKTYSILLAARHGKGTAWAPHGHGMLSANRTLESIAGVWITERILRNV